VNPVECERVAADIARWIAEWIWAEGPGTPTHRGALQVLGCDDLDTVDEGAIVLRTGGGQVLDVELEVTVTPHRSARSAGEPLPLEAAP
jgi:hypothetical protein